MRRGVPLLVAGLAGTLGVLAMAGYFGGWEALLVVLLVGFFVWANIL